MPHELDIIVMKCLEKDRSQRYESAGPLADDLAAWLQSGVVRTPPPESLARPRARSSRKVWPVAALVLAAFVCGVFGFLFFNGSLAELLKTLPRDKIIYTHCRGGNRALACGAILKKHGFDVRPLKTGYQGLVEAGFEKAEEKK